MKKGKYTVLVFLAILLATLSVLAACSSTPSPTQTTTASGTTAPATTPVATTSTSPSTTQPTVKPIVLKFTTHNPPVLSVSVTEKAWAEKLKEMSGGRLELELYFSESLAKQTEVYRAVQTGVADIGYMVVGSDASQTPLSMMSRRTFMGLPSMQAAAKIFWDLHDKYPEIRAEWKNMKILSANGLPPDQFFFIKKPVRLPKDMAGMKVNARGDYPAIMTAIGASPVSLNVSEWFSSAEKGLVEGQVGIHFLAVNSFKLLDLYKYVTYFGEGGADMATEIHAINMDTWNSLPADLQQILLESCKWYEEAEYQATLEGYLAGVKAGDEKGIQYTNLTPEDIAEWQKVVEPIDQKYIADNASKGPAQAIYDDVKALSKQYADLK